MRVVWKCLQAAKHLKSILDCNLVKIKHEGIYWLFWKHKCFRKEGLKNCSVLKACCASTTVQTQFWSLVCIPACNGECWNCSPACVLANDTRRISFISMCYLTDSLRARSQPCYSPSSFFCLYICKIYSDLFHTLPCFLILPSSVQFFSKR